MKKLKVRDIITVISNFFKINQTITTNTILFSIPNKYFKITKKYAKYIKKHEIFTLRFAQGTL